MRDVEISHLLVLIDRADRVVLAEEVSIPIRDVDGVHTAVRKRLDGGKGVLVRVLHLRVHRGRASYGLLGGGLEAVVWVLPGIC